MALTVKGLSESLNKTIDEVITMFVDAGIVDKNADSKIYPQEVKIFLETRKNKLNANTVSPVSNKIIENDLNINVNKNSQVAVAIKKENDKVIPDNDSVGTVKKETLVDSSPDNKKTSKQTIKLATTTPAKKDSEKVNVIKKQTQKEVKKNKRPRNFPNNVKRGQSHLASPRVNKYQLNNSEKTVFSQKIKDEQAQHAFKKPVDPIIYEVEISENIKISDLAQKMNTKVGDVLKILMGIGVMVTINDVVDKDTATLVVEEMGHIGVSSKKTIEEDVLSTIEHSSVETKRKNPVVTIMGHVDHGKTSLLDCIGNIKVTASEIGNITQCIRAFQVIHNDNTITFIDTPGHAVFSKMRFRGANATDIVVLVVAADDGVMPQTIESIKYVKDADVPIIVAINKIDKIDKETTNTDKIKQVLTNYDLVAEEWGGDTMVIEVSALTNKGIDKLLEAISLTAEILELNAPYECSAGGVVLEARLDKGRGKIATILIQSGTLKKGDILIAGFEYGKVKQIINDKGKIIQEAYPAMPVDVIGLSGVPDSGSRFLIVDSERKAREVTNFKKAKARELILQKQQSINMKSFLSKIEDEKIHKVNLLIKADVKGSVQAIVEALEALSTSEVRVKIIFSGVGAINNTDIMLAATYKAFVFGFNVRADSVARKTVEQEDVTIEYYSIIYNLIDDVKAIMSGMLSLELSENIIGIASVKEVFKSLAFGDVAGCIVSEGVIRRDSAIRVLRENVVIYEGELESLRRFKDNVAEVKSGVECGIGVLAYKDVKIDDQIEVFERIENVRSI